MGASGGIKQIFHPYSKWECAKNGMWKDVIGDEAEKLLPIAIRFTGNHLAYGEAMRNVIYKWRYSCENFLTDKNINRKAWLGHAACSLELNLPENVVRMAWKELSQTQRDLANKQAEMYIKEWEGNFLYKQLSTQLNLFDESRNREVYQKLGKKVLLKGNTRRNSTRNRKENKSSVI